jgi:plasmid stabilization system protein ParE
MDKGSYKIIWSSEALNNLSDIINYLCDNWNEKVATRFLDKLDKKLSLLSNQPSIGHISEKDPIIRSVLLSKHNRLYYSIYNNTIELLHILDTRQNPIKNPY